MEWAQQYAEALARAVGSEGSLSPEEEEAVLLLARLVAHGTDRRNAPLASFLAGWFSADRARNGVSPVQALAEATAIAEDLLASGPGGDAPVGQPAT